MYENRYEMWGYRAQMWVIEGAGTSVAQHLSPHGSCINCGHFGSCLVCLYLCLADELWQLTPEQPVRESACNEEFAVWQTDSFIFLMKLFPCATWLWQAQSAYGRQITASFFFFFFVSFLCYFASLASCTFPLNCNMVKCKNIYHVMYPQQGYMTHYGS